MKRDQGVKYAYFMCVIVSSFQHRTRLDSCERISNSRCKQACAMMILFLNSKVSEIRNEVHCEFKSPTGEYGLLRHTFCSFRWVNTIVYILLITLFLRCTMTLFLLSCRYLSIVFYLLLVLLYSLLRCIILTHINLLWSCLYVSHTLFLIPTLCYFILHAFSPYLNRIPRRYILLQLVWHQSR